MLICKKYLYFIIAVAFGLNLLFLWGMAGGTEKSTERITDKKKKTAELFNALSSIIQQDSFARLKVNYQPENMQEGADDRLLVFTAPPWTRLAGQDISELLQKTDDLIISSSLGLSDKSILPSPISDKNDIKGKNRKSAIFPLVYSGYMKMRNKGRALIEDTQTGTSYFRSNGDKFLNYTIVEIAQESLILINTDTGKKIRLLRGKEQ